MLEHRVGDLRRPALDEQKYVRHREIRGLSSLAMFAVPSGRFVSVGISFDLRTAGREQAGDGFVVNVRQLPEKLHGSSVVASFSSLKMAGAMSERNTGVVPQPAAAVRRRTGG
jgi:hypothetical protein